MPRKVAVEATLEAAKYLAAAAAVEKSTAKMDHEMGQLDKTIDAVDRDMLELSVSAEVASHQVDDLGDQARGTAADFKILEARLDASKKKVRELGLEFARTGEAMAGKELSKERSLLGRLEKLHKELADLNDEMSIPQVSASVSGLGGGGGGLDLSSMGGMGRGGLIGGVVGLVAMAAPAIGAMVAGAVVGGVATGGVVGGVIAASRDPRVKAAWQNFTGGINSEMFGGPKLVEPTIRAISVIDKALDDLGLAEALGMGGPAIENLSRGVGAFAEGIMPGFLAIMKESGPISQVLAEGLATVGESIGDMLTTMVEADGALEGLEALLDGIGWTIRTTGDVVAFLAGAFKMAAIASSAMSGGLEDVFHWLTIISPVAGVTSAFMGKINDITEDYAGTTEKLSGQLVHMSTAAGLASKGLDPFAGYLKEASDRARELDDSLMTLFDHVLGITDSTIAFEQSIDDLTESVKENGTSLDINGEKGRNNMRAIQDAIKDAIRVRDEMVKTDGVEAANRKFNEMLARIQGVAAAAGISKKALDDMVAKVYTVSIVYSQSTRGSRPSFLSGHSEVQDLYRAAGGPVEPGVPYKINEKGYETVTFPAKGDVHPANLTPMPWNGGGVSPGGGERVIRVIVSTPDGRVLRNQLVDDATGRGIPPSAVAAAFP